MKVKIYNPLAGERIFLVCLGGAFLLASCFQDGATVLPDKKTAANTAKPSLTHEIFVNAVGANGNDNLDDTKAFQKAIDSMAGFAGGGTVKANAGTYYINADTAIVMKSNVILDLQNAQRILKALPSNNGRYDIIRIWNTDNVTINQGTIIGDLFTHTGPVCTGSCEQGYGISIKGSRNTVVYGSYIKYCWGDGIIVTGLNGQDSYNIRIDSVVCDSNRRQGLTIGGGTDLITVQNSHFKNTGQYNGTAPMAGIDIEPDNGWARNISITGCRVSGNKGKGVLLFQNPTTSAKISYVTVTNNEIYNHKTFAGWVDSCDHVTFKTNNLHDNVYIDANNVSHNRNGIRVYSPCVSCDISPILQ